MPTAPQPTRLPRLTLLLLTNVSVAFGCSPSSTAPLAADAAGPAPSAEGRPEAAGDKRLPPTAVALAPVLRERGEEGVVPSAIAVELALPIADASDSAVGAKTVLELQPPTPGTISRSSPSTLIFTPTDGFRAGTEYTARLVSVETNQGVVNLSPRDAPPRVFRTPPFRFVRVDFKAFTPKKNRLEVELVFSAPLEPGSVTGAALFSLDGESVERVTFEPTDRKNVMRATIFDRRLRPGVTVEYAERGAIRSAVEQSETIERGHGRVTIQQGQAIRILASHVEEGASGFFVEVICADDAASKPEDRFWHYDRVTHESYQVSRRCVLEESDAKESVHFSPPVKFTISPTRGGFRLLGDFTRGTYAMRIDANARSVDGGVLESGYSASFSVPARKPEISFAASGRYLPKSAWKELAIRHMNVGQVDVTIRNVSVENLVFWMTADQESADPRTSDIIARRHLALPSPPDRQSTSFLAVEDLVPSPPRGVLEVELAAPGARPAHVRLLVTDINLLAKVEGGTGNIHVFALGMHDNNPIPGVLVKAVVASGRVARTCTTDRLGGCELKKQQAEGAIDPAVPFALIASREGDVTYLQIESLKTQIADALVSGRPFSSTTPYRAAVYADRGVFRPGETAHLVALLRSEKDVAPPEGMPVDVTLVDPQQKVLRKLQRKTNAAGVIAQDFKFDDFATTGVYHVKLEAGGKPIGASTFNVEAFVPERMKASARIDTLELLAAEKAPIEVSARYLFGGSAAGSKVELTCELQPARFTPKLNAGYEYGTWHQAGKPPAPTPLGTVSGTLGAGDVVKLACPTAHDRGGYVGPSRLVAKANVFEAGSGRTTQAEASARVHPESFYIGLTTRVRTAKGREPFTVEGVVVDWGGKTVEVSRSIELELLRVETERGWIYEEVSGRWVNEQYAHLTSEGVLPSVATKDGKFQFTVTPGSDAEGFVVRARAGRAETALSVAGVEGYAGWWDAEDFDAMERDQTPRPLKPASIDLAVPTSLEVGKKAVVTFDAPFPGRALLSVETDRLLTHEWIDVTEGKVEWPFRVTEFAPNVYVSAFLVKDPHQESKASFLPSRAFAVESVRIEPRTFDHAPKLRVPSEIRSGSKLEVELDVGPLDEPTFATVAAIDEGILSLTRFATPDPLSMLFDRRALGVLSSETIGWNLLLPEAGPSKTTGGDVSEGLERAQPVKPVALWSGVLEMPTSGKLPVRFDVPEYRGSLRVMAVTLGSKRMGSASQNVTVRDPVVIQATIPRFLTAGDRAEVPVFVSNVSGKSAEVTVSLAAEKGPNLALAGDDDASPSVEVEGATSRRVTLADGVSERVVFGIRGLASYGAAKIVARVSSSAASSEQTVELPLLPAGPRTRRVQRVELSAGQTDLTPYLRGWTPTTERSTFWVTGNPYGDAFDHLGWLLSYPYGCLEQTTSSTWPLLHVGNLVHNVEPSLVARDRIEALVMSGVNRILSMQTGVGGFAYWPGARGEPARWASTYATHLLLDAKKLRYPVPEERLSDALEWLGREAAARSDRQGRRDLYAPNEDRSEPYMELVLALAGRGSRPRVERLIEEVRAYSTQLSEAREHLYMLQAALYLMGDHRYEAELKNPDLSAISSQRSNSWSFYSDRRRRGLMLALFSDLFGPDPAGEPLAAMVAESLRAHADNFYTTQELAWAITGLGKRIGETVKTFPPPSLSINGKTRTAQPTASGPASSDRSYTVARASEAKRVTLDLQDTKGGKVFVVLSSEGIRQNAEYALGGAGLSVARSYRRLDGEPYGLADGSIGLGSVVYVLVTLKNTTGERIQNVALVDRFAAGFEIENPRLGRGNAALSFVHEEDLWAVESMDLRDDRIQVFGSLEARQSRTFVYALRAVSAGQFMMPPIEAEAMYYPEHWAREAGGRVVVRGPVRVPD